MISSNKTNVGKSLEKQKITMQSSLDYFSVESAGSSNPNWQDEQNELVLMKILTKCQCVPTENVTYPTQHHVSLYSKVQVKFSLLPS